MRIKTLYDKAFYKCRRYRDVKNNLLARVGSEPPETGVEVEMETLVEGETAAFIPNLGVPTSLAAV